MKGFTVAGVALALILSAATAAAADDAIHMALANPARPAADRDTDSRRKPETEEEEAKSAAARIRSEADLRGRLNNDSLSEDEIRQIEEDPLGAPLRPVELVDDEDPHRVTRLP